MQKIIKAKHLIDEAVSVTEYAISQAIGGFVVPTDIDVMDNVIKSLHPTAHALARDAIVRIYLALDHNLLPPGGLVPRRGSYVVYYDGTIEDRYLIGEVADLWNGEADYLVIIDLSEALDPDIDRGIRERTCLSFEDDIAIVPRMQVVATITISQTLKKPEMGFAVIVPNASKKKPWVGIGPVYDTMNDALAYITTEMVPAKQED